MDAIIHKIAAHLPRTPSLIAVLVCLSLYAFLAFAFWKSHKSAKSVYFDAQDFLFYEKGAERELPQSAATSTFMPLLQHYIGITQILITVAAASIAFGGGQAQSASVYFAKVCLASSILFGVLFCSTLLYRYDEYMQNVRSYTRVWYTLVESFGFTCVACFFLGFFVWALGI
jgi:hypothetical protein